jgi:hypothetical protein
VIYPQVSKRKSRKTKIIFENLLTHHGKRDIMKTIKEGIKERRIKTMTKSRIYNLAMHELLSLREKEEEYEKAGSTIATARLEKLDKDISELHEMILEAEKKGE